MALWSGIDTTNPMRLYGVLGQAYATNDFDAHRLLLGPEDTSYDTGILGPDEAGSKSPMGSGTQSSGGSLTQGSHQFRYRYRDSRTGYVSNPSDAVTVDVSSASQKITFSDGGTHYTKSSDGRVDQIVVEMTAVNSGDFFVAAYADNDDTTVEITFSDTQLRQQDSVAALWGGVDDVDSFSHNQPPLAAFGVEHKGLHIIGGHHDREYTTLTLTQSSTAFSTVSGEPFSSQWADRERALLVEDDNFLAVVETFSSTTAGTMNKAWPLSTQSDVSATLIGVHSRRIHWTLPGYPEAFDTTARARDVLVGRNDVLRAAYSQNDLLLLFGDHSASYMTWSDSPKAGDGQEIELPGHRGALNQACVVDALGRVYAFDRRGVWSFVGEGPVSLSDAVQPIIESDIDWTARDKFHLQYDPVYDVLMAFFVKSGDTEPKFALAFEIRRQTWSLYQFDVGITAGTISRKTDNNVRLLLGDENLNLWAFGDEGRFDGAADGSAYYTCDAGCTTTVLKINETITAGLDYTGVVLHDPTQNESREVASNTTGSSATITLSSALSVAPSAGDQVFLGRIPFVYFTKWEIGSSVAAKKRFTHFHLYLDRSDSVGVGKVYIYADFDADTPLTFTGEADTTHSKAVDIVPGNNYASFRLDATRETNGAGDDGYISVPIPATWVRALAAKVEVEETRGQIRILDMGFVLAPDGETARQA